MTQKLNCILLIDDDAPTNFLNEYKIRKLECVENITSVLNGQAGLEYLLSETCEKCHPEFILLDLNMPAMNGWEFLEKYREYNLHKRGTVIIMVTTSLNPDDKDRAERNPYIKEFLNKPLDIETFAELLGKYFPKQLID